VGGGRGKRLTAGRYIRFVPAEVQTMRRFRIVPVALVVLIFSALAQADAKFLTRDDVSAIIGVLSPPPKDGSPEQQAEIAKLLDLQKNRTPQDVERAEKNSHLTGFLFADVLGDWFNAKDLPLTAKLMTDVGHEAGAVDSAAKDKFKRDRPFVGEPRLHPTLQAAGYSYPSGHSTAGMTYALILAEMFPEHRDALIAKGTQVGDDREVAGVHYPSDVAGGRKIAAEIAKRLLADPQFHAEMEKAIDEVHADAGAPK
jgi:acid phosphatase (class A)